MDSLIKTNPIDQSMSECPAGESSISDLLKLLKRNQQRGSKPRCHLFTDGQSSEVAARLTDLMGDHGSVGKGDFWMPGGFKALDEAQLDKATRLIPDRSRREALRNWWLSEAGSKTGTPNWDIASSCTIEGKPGLLLVEAKAHGEELKEDDRCGARSEKNRVRIGEAIGEANRSLNELVPGWHLSHESHYQLSNRFAWSWKLASLEVPVVLVYLGFLNALEMGDSFDNAQSWRTKVQRYSEGIVPEKIWDDRLLVNGVPIYPLIQAREISLKAVTVRTK